jgi:MoaA/NifB/PqqE/SkfB family radical SAM enzyme
MDLKTKKSILPPKHNHYIFIRIKLFLVAVWAGKISARKLWNVFVCSLAYIFKTKYSARAPIVLSLELWNECNAGCLFCRDAKGRIYNINPEYPDIDSISKGKMSPEMAKDIIGQLKEDVLIAVLYTNGEPLLYPDLADVVKFSTANKVMTMISTNGLLFTEDNARHLLEAGIDLIKIQLGGFTQDIYSIQVRYGDVEKLKNNIRKLVRLKEELKSHAVILIDWMTYNYNRHQIPLIRRFCKELGLMVSFRQGNPRGGLEDKETPLPVETLSMSCDWLWKGMQVDFNGNVLPCCDGVIWANIKPYSVYITGTSKVKEIWNGPAAQATREFMRTKGRRGMSICKQCQRTGIAFKW